MCGDWQVICSDWQVICGDGLVICGDWQVISDDGQVICGDCQGSKLHSRQVFLASSLMTLPLVSLKVSDHLSFSSTRKIKPVPLHLAHKGTSLSM